jgi:orotate phosphoribosyltransferase
MTQVNLEETKSELRGILMTKSVRQGTFTLASGKTSDLYIDARTTTSDPRAALLIGKIGWEIVKQTCQALKIRADSVRSIGGLTMGADWMALSIGIAAQFENNSSEVKAFSVRKDAKKHGLQKLIEGNFAPGNSVVVVDDVITTGGSTIKAIEAIEAAEGRVAFVVVLVDRQEGGRENIEKRGHKVVPIFTRSDLLPVDAPRRSHIAVG